MNLEMIIIILAALLAISEVLALTGLKSNSVFLLIVNIIAQAKNALDSNNSDSE